MKKNDCDFLTFLRNHENSNLVSFHMPGAKRGNFFNDVFRRLSLENFLGFDITEIQGADNLHKPESIIKDIADGYKEIYKSKHTFLLINGSSVGIISAILASCKKSKKIIVARNSHKSIYAAIDIGGITPIYISPDSDNPYDISANITPGEVERAIKSHPDASAIILPSPNYYGICSDIKKISRLAKKHDIILIVDQAHGAHLTVFKTILEEESVLPLEGAENYADIVINSTHKTLASFTQTAILNVMSDRIDISEIAKYLSYLQSTSPSYLLLSSLAANLNILKSSKGYDLLLNWQNLINDFYAFAKDNEIELVTHPLLDKTKINIFTRSLNLSAEMLNKELIDDNIIPELYTGDILMLMSGIGNTDDDFAKLKSSLMRIKGKYKDKASYNTLNIAEDVYSVHEKKMGYGKKITIPLSKSEGFPSASLIIPYPPGIPLLCPFEVITEKDIAFLTELMKHKYTVLGITKDLKIDVYI